MYRCERTLIKAVIVLALECLEERGYYAASPTYAKSGDHHGYRVAGCCIVSVGTVFVLTNQVLGKHCKN